MKLAKWLIVLSVCLAPLACTNLPAVQQQANATLTQVQSDIATAQTQLSSLRAQLATAQTQPSTPAVVATEQKIQGQIDVILAWIAKAQPVADGLQRAVNTPPGQSPDFSFLGSLGPWGLLAGTLASIGYGVYQNIQKGKAQEAATASAQQVADIKPSMDHIQAVTETDTPVAAAAAVTSTVAPVAISAPTTLIPRPVTPPGA